MSTNKNKLLLEFGVRLSQERKRLGYTQAGLADLFGKSAVTQYKYESGETQPDADYFFALHKLGADIHYIITGEMLEALKELDERQLLKNYRTFDDRDKTLMQNLFKDIVKSDVSKKKLTANKSGAKEKK
jgi:transcriptional regulator with XRE-family HTH domain